MCLQGATLILSQEAVEAYLVQPFEDSSLCDPHRTSDNNAQDIHLTPKIYDGLVEIKEWKINKRNMAILYKQIMVNR